MSSGTEDDGEVQVILVQKKTKASVAVAGSTKKRPAAEEDPSSSSSGSSSKKKAARLADDAATCTWLEPMQPLPNYRFPPSQRQNFVIYLAIREQHGSPFSIGLEKCAVAAASNPTIHSLCFQRDGTRHITMFQGALTPPQANALQFVNDDDDDADDADAEPSFAPFPIKFRRGWNNWKAGLYLALDDSTTHKLKHLLGKVRGLPATGGRRSCNHLSLYRKRGGGNNVSDAFAKIRTALASYDWGSGAQGASIRIKLVGTGYDECKVLAGV